MIFGLTVSIFVVGWILLGTQLLSVVRNRPGLPPSLVILWAVLLGWAFAIEQRTTDLDSFLFSARIRQDWVDQLFTVPRPFQYRITHWLYSLFGKEEPGYFYYPMILSLFGLGLTYLVIWLGRKTFFGGLARRRANLAILLMALSPAGEYMADSWNDHAILKPFYFLGLFLVLRFWQKPWLSVLGVLPLFLINSLFHVMETYIWLLVLGAYVLGSAGKRALMAASVTLATALGLTITAILIAPNASGEAAYFASTYGTLGRLSFGEKLVMICETSNRIAPNAPGFFPGYLFAWVVLGLVAFQAAVRQKLRRELPWILAMFGALMVPVVYEPDNPERHLHYGLLIPILLVRLGRGISQFSFGIKGLQHGAPRMLGQIAIPLVAIVWLSSGMTLLRTIPDRSDWFRGAVHLRLWVPKDALVVSQRGDFWHHIVRVAVPRLDNLITERAPTDRVTEIPQTWEDLMAHRGIIVTGTATQRGPWAGSVRVRRLSEHPDSWIGWSWPPGAPAIEN